MTWKLWLDDQIHDPETPERWTPEGFTGSPSTQDAIRLVKLFGMPEFMNLDHDLGGEDKVIHFLNQLFDLYPDGPIPDFLIHSANPEGAKNIYSFMDSWRRSMDLP